MHLTRRQFAQFLSLGGIFSALPLRKVWAQAADGFRHGLSLFGALKYPDRFGHFDYVRADAPKGGKLRMMAIGSFDSLNPYSFKGDPAAVAATNETLLTASADEPSSEYGLIAEAVSHPEDFSSVTYRLHKQACFHDGEPIKPEDVIWSLEALKASHPSYNFYYKNVTSAEKTGEHEVTFRFSEKGNRELPQITGQLPVLPKHWWTGTDANGKPRDISATTLEIPLGSGPYKCVEVKPGDMVRLERVKDYWGEKLPVNIGQNNFDEMAYVYFKDETVALEAFRAGQYDIRVESSAKNWATAYDFPAVKEGRVILDKIPDRNSKGMQAYVFNTRRAKFTDARVRQAFNLAFDFEWANANLFYGQYQRTGSYFSNSELASSGVLSDPLEKSILEPLKDKVPAEVFTTAFANPINANTTDQRNNLRKAMQLLQAAGYSQKQVDGKAALVDAKGEPLSVEFLNYSPLFERITLPYIQNLAKLGIGAQLRTIDSAQYVERVRNFDFDIVVGTFGQSLSPGNEQRNFWGSEAADRPGSNNLIGIKDAAIDALVDRIIFAKDRTELVTATRALDRVLLWHHYVVPMWNLPYTRVAWWNRFGKPDRYPDYNTGIPTVWWFDAEKSAKTG